MGVPLYVLNTLYILNVFIQLIAKIYRVRHKTTLNVYHSGSNKHLGVVFALNSLFKQPLSFKKRIF